MLVPLPRETRTIPFPENLEKTYGNKTITLDYPPALRLGETGQVIMLVKVPDGENSKNTSQVAIQPGFQARLDMPANRVLPSDLQSSSFDPESGVEYSWKLIPMASGVFEGTLKVYASQGQTLPPGVSGELIFAIPLAIKIQRVLGMPVDVARVSVFFFLVLVGFTMLVLFKPRR